MSGDSVPSIVVGADGRARCRWAATPEIYRDYHDTEWAVAVHDEQSLFERVSLEAFQSGLSWLTILRKRDTFRAAFAGFDPDRVAQFTDHDVERLLADTGIVRNRAKIEATLRNAQAVIDLRADGGLAGLLWSYRTDPVTYTDLSHVPSTTPESVSLAKDLKRRGFSFVGPTTAYAAMQACGVVNDHVMSCFRFNEVSAQ